MTAYLPPKIHVNLYLRGLLILISVSLFLFYASSALAAEVTLAWNPNSEDDLAGYAIYSSQDSSGPPYDQIATYDLQEFDSASPQCVITGLEEDTTYYFVVTAFDADGNESGYSDEVCVLNGKECSVSDPDPDSNMDLIQDFVTRFYQQCLDRNPDTPGLEGWSTELFNHNLTGADVARGFIYSPEFLEKNTSNEEYLTILYRAFFDREPDSGGFNGWLDVLNSGMDRDYVLDGFLYSNEFIELCDAYDIVPN